MIYSIRKTQWFAMIVAICSLNTGGLFAQSVPDFTTNTLNFDNITNTNINQTVAESADNEKEVEFGDYDNDGDLDVVMAVALSDFGQRRNKLYRNDNGVLNEVSGAPVIPGFGFTDTSRSVFFRDFDLDGFLDIIVINDSNSGAATNDSPGKTKFFRNVGGTSFVNESGRLSGQTGAACNGTAVDFDGNGFCDLLMCNYPGLSQDTLGFNNMNGSSPGQFTIVTGTNYPSELEYGVHSEAADMNGDGTLDVLIANWQADPSFIYYNDNDITSGVDQNTSSGVGDFRYNATGSQSNFPTGAGTGERSMIPADFNGDGRMDFIFTNAGGFGASRADVLYINTGNDAHNRAVFATQMLSTALNSESIKASCEDLDGDGRPDIVVMSEIRRPYIFRNTSENGNVSFVEWTPAMFTTAQEGWQANSADITGNGRRDLFMGAYNDDFLFENVDSSIIDSSSLAGGALPAFHNAAPIAVTGELAVGDSETFSANIPSGARVSVLVRSIGDMNLVVRQGGSVIASSTQVGHGTDEAVEFVSPGGALTFEVTGEAVSFDGNGDGAVNLLDVNPFIDCLSGASTDCDAFDIFDIGSLNLLVVSPFIDALSVSDSSDDYVIEFLSRTN